VLLVNDDDDGLFLLERAVTKDFPGATVFKCKGAAAALHLLETESVDAIITDNRMPEMSGVAMVRAIRARNVDTPILMLSGAGDVETEAFEVGVTGFLAGGSWDEIRSRIRDMLRPLG
jgi:two-component system, NtrC family, response regulator HupR/HoxA